MGLSAPRDFREPHPTGTVGARIGTHFFPGAALVLGCTLADADLPPLPSLGGLAVGGLATHPKPQQHARCPLARHGCPICVSI